MRKQAVVIATTSSEPVALMSEGHAWNDGKVDVLIVGEESPCRLLNAEGGACGEGRFPFVDVEGEFVTVHSG